jgi:thymidylate kinase
MKNLAMEIIFEKIGYSLSSVRNKQEEVNIDLLVINNTDGLPRWIWNANCKQPLFLKFYNIGSVRALIFATLIRVVFVLKLQKIVFHKKRYFFSKLGDPLFDATGDWALFMGTIGLNSKAILYANKCFYKIATNETVQKMIATEWEILNEIKLKNKEFITPIAKSISKDILQLTDISCNGIRTKKLNASHLNALVEMSLIERKTVSISQWQLFHNLKKDLKKIDDKRIPTNIIRKINTLIQNTSPNEKVELCLSQGDFTQWNMYEINEKIAIYDWELASLERSKGFDYFHFIVQQGILIERKSWKFIYQDILKFSENEFGNQLFNKGLNESLKWYLLLNVIANLKTYANHPEWYKQIHWSLQVWDEALNTFLEEEYSHRQMVIMDLFDLLQNQDYAALKYPGGYPENLSINSDIDLVIDKKNNKTIVKYLKSHALVSKITVNQKSFMNTIQVFTRDGSILSVDLIWQLKIKNHEILSAKQVIANNYIKKYGIKHASEIDTARFIILFYVLNKSKIPEKYLVYLQAIENSDDSLDLILQDYFNKESKDCLSIEFFVKQKKENRNFSFFKNTLNYLVDTLKNLTHSRGFTITFSGVDGAGKSTVIEQLTHRIEKQLRKPVVVLRHRPSILPILSVWTKGKQKAHQDSIDKLPRQGKNINLTSSFFRFSYYYLDYLIGQFVIYFKYILRGYVVIYDRYYFDFINDSKRSNIVLSKKISSLGYQFLLKPKFNFFLFADASIILNRKKELSKSTIEQLTNDYKNLFKTLKSKSPFTVYESINNEDLEVTLQYVVTTIIQNEK